MTGIVVVVVVFIQQQQQQGWIHFGKAATIYNIEKKIGNWIHRDDKQEAFYRLRIFFSI